MSESGINGSKMVERSDEGMEKGTYLRMYRSSENVEKGVESCLFRKG
jgi:hypothetical protein